MVCGKQRGLVLLKGCGQDRLKGLRIKQWQPFIEALAEPYSDTQRKFKDAGVEATLTDSEKRFMEPEDLIHQVGIESALALGLLSVDIQSVDRAVKAKLIDGDTVEPLVQTKQKTSMSIRLVPKKRKR